MSKRVAGSELNHDNWDQEDEPEEAGTFRSASDDVIKNRVIKVAKRRGIHDGPTAASGGAFKGFSGFGAAASSSGKSEFNFAAKKPSDQQPAASFSNGSSATKKPEVQTDNSSSKSKYLNQLKALNLSVLSWIKQHVEKNPYLLLNPIFKDYEKHLIEIEKLNPDKNSSVSKTPALTKIEEKEEKPTETSIFSIKKEVKTEVSDAPAKKASPIKFGATSTSDSDSKDTKPAGFGFSFNAPKSSSEDNKSSTTTGPTFGLASKTETTQSGFSFGTSTETKSGFSFSASTSSGASGFSFGSTSGSSGLKPFSFEPKKQTDGGEAKTTDTGGDEEYEPPKPEVVEIKEEGAVYSKRCKLFYQKDGSWIDKGVGNVHLKVAGDKKIQVIIRADTNLGNILLNIILPEASPLSRQGKNNVSFVCIPSPPLDPKAFDDTEPKPVPMLLRLKTGEEADGFIDKVNELRG